MYTHNMLAKLAGCVKSVATNIAMKLLSFWVIVGYCNGSQLLIKARGSFINRDWVSMLGLVITQATIICGRIIPKITRF